MQQHPVPRNISGFQFHLIGDMTLRQFIYLAVSIGIAYALYKIAPLPFILKVGTGGIFVALGFAFAFVPIGERSLDRWLVAFIKSIYSPTQYLWKKEGTLPEVLTTATFTHIQPLPAHHVAAHIDAKEKLSTYLESLPKTPDHAISLHEKRYIDNTLSLFRNVPSSSTPSFSTTSHPPAPGTPTAKPTPPMLHADRAYSQQSVQPPTSPISTPSPVVHDTVPQQRSLEDELKKLAEEKERLLKELHSLKNPIKEAAVIPPFAPASPTPTPNPLEAYFQSPPAKQPAPQKKDTAGMYALNDVPNIIRGVARDGQGKFLPNIIITIKDATGTPVRALKTNKLGQFETATQLVDGAYRIEAEDPMKRFVFEAKEATLQKTVCAPLELIARGEKEILRAQLTKELFGPQIGV